jgi:tetratricopeptide (TPR) repeat protein
MMISRLKKDFVRTLVVLAIAGAAQPALAATASELFADGNRLFRDDLYWAALLRYDEAASAGMDTPLLHYNIGVAHYKAGQYIRSREALRKSASYGPLTPISHYNLGLTAHKLGNYDEAIDWLRQAADQEERRDIARLARRAIRLLSDEREIVEPAPIDRVAIQQERKYTNFDFRLRSGVGMDDNVFRTPSESYVDISDPNNPVVVTPEVQSGMYVPVSLSARYQVNALENEGFFGSYRFAGRYYQDEALKGADEYLHEAAFGSEYRNRTEDGETHIYSAFKMAQHDETYYDPDDGLPRIVSGIDISDRMSYVRYGPEFWARKRMGRFTIGARAKGQLWNYNDVFAVPEYDHEFLTAGLHTDFRLSQTSLLRLSGDYYTRRYGDRPSFELDGTQPLGNPPVRYDYIDVGIEARQRITSGMWFGIGYSRTNREDKHVGYNNYVRDEYAAQFHLRISDRFRFETRARYSLYDYENAFAFHEPTAGRKTMERVTGTFVAAYRMTNSLELVGEYYLRDVTSSDPRLAYNRGRAILSIRWFQ